MHEIRYSAVVPKDMVAATSSAHDLPKRRFGFGERTGKESERFRLIVADHGCCGVFWLSVISIATFTVW